MKKNSVRGCPICLEKACAILHTQRFILPEGCPLPSEYDVVCCDRCGFVFADTAAQQAAYSEFYANESKYTDNKTSTGGGGSPGERERFRNAAQRIGLALKDRAARIVDIGCANGGLLSALKEQGYTNLCGIDPAPACANYTRQSNAIETYVASLDKMPSQLGPFDGVILSHVLEHVLDLHQALEGVHAIVKPGGVLYVEVPDAGKYCDFVVAPFQDFNTEHINHFSHPSLRNLAEATGFKANLEGDVLLESAPGMPYPAIHQCWSVATISKAAPVQDTELRKNVEHYIKKSRTLINRMEKQLEQDVQTGEPVLIWGVGQLAMKLLAETSLGKATIAGFVDSNPIHQGKQLHGHPILAPAGIQGMPYPILIASTLHAQSISRQIRNELGMQNKLILLNFNESPEG
jgi:SAM-dependent methyltransferase